MSELRGKLAKIANLDKQFHAHPHPTTHLGGYLVTCIGRTWGIWVEQLGVSESSGNLIHIYASYILHGAKRDIRWIGCGVFELLGCNCSKAAGNFS